MKPATGTLMWCGFLDVEVRRRPMEACFSKAMLWLHLGEEEQRGWCEGQPMDAAWIPQCYMR